MQQNPDVKREDVPVDLVKASGGGLDPHISPEAALVQVARIAKTRNIGGNKLIQLVNQQIEKPFLGILGTSTVNVLRLNIALDKLK